MKAQIIVKEVIAFAIGVMLVIGCAYTFGKVHEQYARYARIELSTQLLSQLDFLLNEVYSIASGAEMSYKTSLPAQLATLRYIIYSTDHQLCIRFFGALEKWCRNSTLPRGVELRGEYVSGHKLVITCKREGEKTVVEFRAE